MPPERSLSAAPCATLPVSRPSTTPGSAFEPLEQRVDPGHDGRPRRGPLELLCQKVDVALAQRVDAGRRRPARAGPRPRASRPRSGDRSCRRTGSARTRESGPTISASAATMARRPAPAVRRMVPSMSNRTSFRVTAPPAAARRRAARGGTRPGCPAARAPAPSRRSAIVECTSVSASPAKATWVIRSPEPSRKNSRSPGRMSSSATTGAAPRLLGRVARQREAAGEESGLHQPRAVDAATGSPRPTDTARPRSARGPSARAAWSRAACTASAAQARAPSATRPRRPSGRRTLSPSSATRARSGSRTAGPSPMRTTAPRLQPVASCRQASALRVVYLDAVPGVDPTLVAVEIDAHASPVARRTRARRQSHRGRAGSPARTEGSAARSTGTMAARAMTAVTTGRLCLGGALAAERHAAKGADQADERAALGAGIALGGPLLAAAGPAAHGVVLA